MVISVISVVMSVIPVISVNRLTRRGAVYGDRINKFSAETSRCRNVCESFGIGSLLVISIRLDYNAKCFSAHVQLYDGG